MVADKLLYSQPCDYCVVPRQPCPQLPDGLESAFTGEQSPYVSPHFTMWRPILGYENVEVMPLPSQPVTNALLEPCYIPRRMTTKPIHFPNLISGFERNPAHAAHASLNPRYTNYEWDQNNINVYNESITTRNYSERLRCETVRIIREADETTHDGQMESGRRIGERISDLNYWKDEALAEFDAFLQEVAQLQDKRRDLEKAIQDIEGPLHIAQECLSLRERRMGIDLVSDGAEEDLMKEIQILRDSQDRLKCMHEKTIEQIRNNLASQHDLERDVMSKEDALSIDRKGHELHDSSADLEYHGGIENFITTLSTPETWADNTNVTIQRAQKERAKSMQLRSDVDNLIESCANDIWSAWERTNVALQNTAGTQQAKKKLESHLHQVQDEIFIIEKYMELLRKALDDKTNPLKVAHRRLEVRSHRRNVEKCRDAAQSRMLKEINDISCSIEHLHRSLEECEAQHQQLLKTRSHLEVELEIKALTLFIDQEQCLGLRRSYPIRYTIKYK